MNRKEILERICEACESVENVDEVWSVVEDELQDVINNFESKVNEIKEKLSIEGGSYSDLDDAVDLIENLSSDLY